MFSSSRWHGLTQPVPASLRECFFDFFEALNSGFLCEITTCFQVLRWHGLTQPVPASLRECFFDFFEALNSGFLCEITTCFQVRGGMG